MSSHCISHFVHLDLYLNIIVMIVVCDLADHFRLNICSIGIINICSRNVNIKMNKFSKNKQPPVWEAVTLEISAVLMRSQNIGREENSHYLCYLCLFLG